MTLLQNPGPPFRPDVPQQEWHCLACRTPLMSIPDTYVFCPACGSARYGSSRTAEEDNRRYFDTLAPSVPLPLRVKWFRRFDRQHRRLHWKETRRFNRTLGLIDSILLSAGTAVEIGFGSGDEMFRWLRMGVDIYGYDLSEVRVSGFKARHPEFADRVFTRNAERFSKQTGAVYSNALFEHLDDPDAFLNQVAAWSRPGGRLILRLPLIVRPAGDRPAQDINFWKPCHRALYTVSGLKTLLQRNGFRLLECMSWDYFGYRAMNRMLQRGYAAIQDVRDPRCAIPGLTSELEYLFMLGSALWTRPWCKDSLVIADRAA